MNILFFGTPDFSVRTLRALAEAPGVRIGAVITQPDKPSGRGGEIRPPPVKSAALELGIPVFQPKSLRREFNSLKSQLLEFGPFDVGVVIAFGQILPLDVLTFPANGCINIHASLLPRWRGAAPIQRAIEAGDQKTGVCLMRMDEGLDTGAVFSSTEISISDDDTAQSLHDALANAGASLLVSDLPAIVKGSLVAIPQPNDGVTYASKVTSEECRIDWSLPAARIKRAIQAFTPHPGAFTTWHGKRLKIFKAKICSLHGRSDNPPGTIVESSGDLLVAQCGEGSLLALEEIQAEGKKRMLTRDFARGTTIASGARLGE
jgi:methionyl-tRNA formyltransferase